MSRSVSTMERKKVNRSDRLAHSKKKEEEEISEP